MNFYSALGASELDFCYQKDVYSYVIYFNQIITCYWMDMGFELVMGFIEHSHLIITSIHNTFIDLNTLWVTTESCQSTMPSLVVAW
jgi:hypothetical protein